MKNKILVLLGSVQIAALTLVLGSQAFGAGLCYDYFESSRALPVNVSVEDTRANIGLALSVIVNPFFDSASYRQNLSVREEVSAMEKSVVQAGLQDAKYAQQFSRMGLKIRDRAKDFYGRWYESHWAQILLEVYRTTGLRTVDDLNFVEALVGLYQYKFMVGNELWTDATQNISAARVRDAQVSADVETLSKFYIAHMGDKEATDIFLRNLLSIEKVKNLTRESLEGNLIDEKHENEMDAAFYAVTSSFYKISGVTADDKADLTAARMLIVLEGVKNPVFREQVLRIGKLASSANFYQKFSDPFWGTTVLLVYRSTGIQNISDLSLVEALVTHMQYSAMAYGMQMTALEKFIGLRNKGPELAQKINDLVSQYLQLVKTNPDLANQIFTKEFRELVIKP